MSEESSVPSTTGATYVEPSADTILEPGVKIGDLYRRNMDNPYVLQRLGERSYWVQSFNYGTVFYVGERGGVIIFDALEGVYDNIVQAVSSVTDKPITAVIYPHYHADHIGDVDKYAAAAREAGHELEIVASAKTAKMMEIKKSGFPRPTKVLDWPRDSFTFDDLTVELHGFEYPAHSDDHSAWLLVEPRILHSSDLINPDQPPFWKFAGNERFVFHEENLRELYDLEWDYLSGSHGNIGSRVDIDFELRFVGDLKAAIGKAIEENPFSDFVDPSAKAHTGFLADWSTAIAKQAVDTIRPTYGELYGFEEAALPNAEMVTWAVFEYR